MRGRHDQLAAPALDMNTPDGKVQLVGSTWFSSSSMYGTRDQWIVPALAAEVLDRNRSPDTSTVDHKAG